MINVNTVETWDELNAILFEDSWNDKIKRYRSPYVFRGLSDSTYDLKTSLIRLGGNYEKLEGSLLRNFKKYGNNINKCSSIWEIVALAQHHGLPTRLLDWTYSPYIALHFVTANLDNFDKDGIIYCVDIKKTTEYLPPNMTEMLECEKANAFTIDLLGKIHGDLENFDKYYEKDFCA